jgi:hypothetical protein
MEAIEKLRNIVEWANLQSEHFNYSVKSLKAFELLHDYAQKNNLAFIDDDYLYNECTEEERAKFYKFFKKVNK